MVTSTGDQVGVGIVGCGLAGHKRAGALGPARLVVCYDPSSERARSVARPAGATVARTLDELLCRPDVQVVIVATPHDTLVDIAVMAAEAGKDILVEKPGGRSIGDLTRLREVALRRGQLVRVGFNHRYHPAIRRAFQLCQRDAVGKLLAVRSVYGHGGRLGYEDEWRADRRRAGGGELIDQGVHLLDLAQWFMGKLRPSCAVTPTFFWEMDVEDNAFLVLRSATGGVAFLHTSWTEWKNTFRFEVFGRTGKLEVTGLGGSYGTEQLTCYSMSRTLGPPQTAVQKYPGPDGSWSAEFIEFLQDIELRRDPEPGLEAAIANMSLVYELYRLAGNDR